MLPIIVEHRRTLFSQLSDVRTFASGATVADVVAALPVPVEFATHGAVYIKRDRQDPGHIVERRHWHRVRPKPGTALFVSCVPAGSEGGKQVFAIIAAIALIAITGFVSAGGLSFLGSAFAAGSIGANVAAAAIAVAGAAALQALTPRPGSGSQADATGATLGVAGISQNTIRPFAQVPAPLGKIRVSPPLLARPWTTIEDTSQFVHVICGVCGPAEITNIKVNETDLEDLPAQDIEVETREGWIGGEQAVIAGSAGVEYDFETSSLLGWTGFQATVTATANGVDFDPTGADPQFRSPAGLTINGETSRYIEIDIERTAVRTVGSWQGVVFYSTSGHGESGSFFKSFPALANTVGARQTYVLDMHSLNLGGTDWATSTITSFRFDFEDGAPDGEFLIHSVKVGHRPEPDPQLTLIRESVFEETISLEMGKHRLENDQVTLIDPQEESYPARHIFRTVSNPDEFRVTLGFPQGITRFDSSSQKALLAFRMRMRRVGDVDWRNLPEMHLEAAIRGPFRQQLRMLFGGVNELDLVSSTSGETPAFLRFYLSNSEWVADSYFGAADSPPGVDTGALHIYSGKDRVLVFLDPAEWPRGAYDVEIQRSFVQNANSGQFSGSNYLGGLFTFRTAGPPSWQIPTRRTSRVRWRSRATPRCDASILWRSPASH